MVPFHYDSCWPGHTSSVDGTQWWSLFTMEEGHLAVATVVEYCCWTWSLIPYVAAIRAITIICFLSQITVSDR